MTMILYLLGIFMGAIDTSIIVPARTVIQNDFGVTESMGVWMITIFTLAYAVSIPIAGKLADKYGRKKVYLISIFLFGLGSLLCGLTSNMDNFGMLLFSRVIQALGSGGIMPVATAEIGTSFPPEKRGVALGIVGGTYGVANILGSTLGSAVLSFVGNANWQWLFYINMPIVIFILIVATVKLPNHSVDNVKKMDFKGTIVITGIILSLMYGLTNIDFFDFYNTFTSVSVYPFLIIVLLLIPLFVMVERRAEDPIVNLKYFTDPQILLTLLISMIAGIAMMGMVFVPQYAENVLYMKTGTGGYLVTLLGLFSGISAPLSGKMIDKKGPQKVLLLGFGMIFAGALLLAYLVPIYGNIWTISAGLFFMGFGMGFTMGTPLNYMMLSLVPTDEASTALSTLSLVRSIGTTLSPNIMIGFIAQAGKSIPDQVMAVLPQPGKLVIPGLENMAGAPDMSSGSAVDMTSSEAFKNLQTADVTTIVDQLKSFSKDMLNGIMPDVQKNIQEGIMAALTKMSEGIQGMDQQIKIMNGTIQDPMALNGAVLKLTEQRERLVSEMTKISDVQQSVPQVIQNYQIDYLSQIESARGSIESIFQQTLNTGFHQMYLTLAIVAIIGILFTFLYKGKSEENEVIDQEQLAYKKI